MERNSIIDSQEEQRFWEDAKAAENAAPLPTDPEWEAYEQMMREEEEEEEETVARKPKHCPIPSDDDTPVLPDHMG